MAADPEVVEVADPTDVRSAPPPPYVVTDADRERWELSGKIAEALWEANAPDEPMDPQFYWTMQRTVYASDVPTGSPDDIAKSVGQDLSEAPEADPLPNADELHQRAWKMWQDVEAQKPGKGATTSDFWDHVGRIADVFDAVFGNPDDYHLGEYEGALAPPEPVEEGLALPGIHVPYNSNLHPRDRMGKWVSKLGGIHAAAVDRKVVTERKVASAVAAERLGHEVRANPLHNPDADEERAREGLRGAVQKVRAGTTRAHNAAIANLGLALMKAEEIEHEPETLHHKMEHEGHGKVAKTVHTAAHTAFPVHRAPGEQTAGDESFHHAMHVSDMATVAGQWAIQHEHELRLIGHALTQTGRALGLSAADVSVEDEQDARSILDSIT